MSLPSSNFIRKSTPFNGGIQKAKIVSKPEFVTEDMKRAQQTMARRAEAINIETQNRDKNRDKNPDEIIRKQETDTTTTFDLKVTPFISLGGKGKSKRGKNRKSKQTKLRSKKYKGKRSKKTRRFRR
jgi:hypothetical protein